MIVLVVFVLFLICAVLFAAVRSRRPPPLLRPPHTRRAVRPALLSREDSERLASTYTERVRKNADGSWTSVAFKRRQGSKRAVLWVHGFNDYFWQFHVGEALLDAGYDVYAVTLRGYGTRALFRDSAYMFYTDDLAEYADDIEWASRAMKAYEHRSLWAHSTGALSAIAVLEEPSVFDALVLNGPFMDFHDSPAKEIALETAVTWLGAVFPRFVVSYGDATAPNATVETIRDRYFVDPDIKRDHTSHVFAGWVRAVRRMQRRIQTGQVRLRVPVLVLHARESGARGDDVLDVREMSYARTLSDHVQVAPVDGAVHDVFASDAVVVERALGLALRWLESTAPNARGTSSTPPK